MQRKISKIFSVLENWFKNVGHQSSHTLAVSLISQETLPSYRAGGRGSVLPGGSLRLSDLRQAAKALWSSIFLLTCQMGGCAEVLSKIIPALKKYIYIYIYIYILLKQNPHGLWLRWDLRARDSAWTCISQTSVCFPDCCCTQPLLRIRAVHACAVCVCRRKKKYFNNLPHNNATAAATFNWVIPPSGWQRHKQIHDH